MHKNEIHEKIFIRSLARRLFDIYALIALLIFSSALSAATINLSTVKNSYSLGETFNVYFNISGLTSNPADSLSGFDLDILYDEAVLTFAGSTFSDPILGNQLDFGEPGALPFFGDVDDSVNGALNAFGISGNSGTVLDANQSDQFAFLGLTFTVNANATAQSTLISIDMNYPFLMFLDSDFGDLNTNIPHSDLLISISSTPSTAIPEPNILLLVTAGVLILLAGSFKRRSS